MKISIEQKHIDAGKKEDGNSCPIALAIKDVLHPDEISVSDDGCIELYYENFMAVLECMEDDELVTFIDYFDNGVIRVKPREFNFHVGRILATREDYLGSNLGF